MNGKHKHVRCGITDVSTEKIHAEIKTFECYKYAIGQLVCYNLVDPKETLQLYLFGSASKDLYETAQLLCLQSHIEMLTFDFDDCNIFIKKDDVIVFKYNLLEYCENRNYKKKNILTEGCNSTPLTVAKPILKDFGYENMIALSELQIRNAMIPINIVNLLESLHFSDNHPENRNFRLISLKNELMEIVKNQKWYSLNLQTGIEYLIKHACRIFFLFLNKNKGTLYNEIGEEAMEKLLFELDEIYNLKRKGMRELRLSVKALLHNYWKDK